MTREDAIRELKQFSGTTRLRLSANFWVALNRAIKALEQEPKIDRLYSYLNDMRFGIAPDETTQTDERDKRLAQIEIIDCIMEWIEKESEEEWKV